MPEGAAARRERLARADRQADALIVRLREAATGLPMPVRLVESGLLLLRWPDVTIHLEGGAVYAYLAPGGSGNVALDGPLPERLVEALREVAGGMRVAAEILDEVADPYSAPCSASLGPAEMEAGRELALRAAAAGEPVSDGGASAIPVPDGADLLAETSLVILVSTDPRDDPGHILTAWRVRITEGCVPGRSGPLEDAA